MLVVGGGLEYRGKAVKYRPVGLKREVKDVIKRGIAVYLFDCSALRR